MKKKETIQTLIDFNKWRRGGEGEQPDPKNIGKAIDNAIATLESGGSYMDYENSYAKKYNECQMVLDAGAGELRFSNMCNEFLYNVLDEIVSMTNDPLTKMVANNAKERYQMDKLIHGRKLFE